MNFEILHSFADGPRINFKLTPSAYIPQGKFFLLQPGGDVLEHIREVYQADAERDAWMERYKNILQGLEYWKNRALEKERELK
jgi:hypothetical protein